MLEHFDEELCDWLVTEMAQNRDKKLVARKVCKCCADELLKSFSVLLFDLYNNFIEFLEFARV